MKKILVPTDFSPRAKDAYLYARELAELFNASIKVVHVFHPSTDDMNPYNVDVTPVLENYKRETMVEFVSIGFENTMEDVITAEQIEHEIIIGFPVEKIIDMTKDEDYDLIVMGTTGKGGHVLEKLLGSVSSKVSQYAHCPVLLIPEGKKFTGIDNIVFAGNYDSTDDKALKSMVEYAQLFNAKIHVVHVYEKEETGISELVFENLIKKKAPDLNFKLKSVTNKSVANGLQEYALDNSVDLIVNVTKQRKFWDNLLHRSVTKRLVLNAKTPLLVLHV